MTPTCVLFEICILSLLEEQLRIWTGCVGSSRFLIGHKFQNSIKNDEKAMADLTHTLEETSPAAVEMQRVRLEEIGRKLLVSAFPLGRKLIKGFFIAVS